MTLTPDFIETLSRARADLRMGVAVVLTCDEGDALILAAETASAARLADLRALGGAAVLAITNWRAATLKVPAYDGDLVRIAVPEDAQIGWVHGMADPAGDLASPMKGPFSAIREGSANLHRLAIRLLKSARLLPAALIVELADGQETARRFNLTRVTARDLGSKLDALSPLHPVIDARLPLSVSEAGRLHVFRPEDGGEEHYAVEIGRPDRSGPVLVRLHSACFTGDLLGSLKCDCGPQLRAALARMGEEGAGILLYLNQEGRGIGLANKMRAYSLQDQGFDTVDANHRLGFEDDERDFRIGAEILRRLDVKRLRLLTNNPAKVRMMEAEGIKVAQRVPLAVGENPHNHNYLATKARKSGHLL